MASSNLLAELRVLVDAEMGPLKQKMNEMSQTMNGMSHRLDRQAKSMNRSFRRMGGHAHNLRQEFNKLARIAQTMFAGYAINRLVTFSRHIVSTHDSLKLLNQRIRIFTGVSGGFADAYLAARQLGIETEKVAFGIGRIVAYGHDLGITTKEAERMTVTFNQLALLSGASIKESQAAFIQFTQALSANRLSGEELRSIREQAPLVAKAIAQYMGITVGEIKKVAEQGLITTDIMRHALAAAAKEAAANFAMVPQTLERQTARLKNAWELAVTGLDDILKQSLIWRFFNKYATELLEDVAKRMGATEFLPTPWLIKEEERLVGIARAWEEIEDARAGLTPTDEGRWARAFLTPGFANTFFGEDPKFVQRSAEERMDAMRRLGEARQELYGLAPELGGPKGRLQEQKDAQRQDEERHRADLERLDKIRQAREDFVKIEKAYASLSEQAKKFGVKPLLFDFKIEDVSIDPAAIDKVKERYQDLVNRIREAGRELEEGLRTPLEVYFDEIEMLKWMNKQGALSEEGLARGVRKAADEFRAADPAIKEAVKNQEEMVEALEAARTPYERLAADVELYQKRLDEGALSPEQYNKLVLDAAQKLKEGFKETTDEISEYSRQAARNIQSAFADFLFDPFEDGVRGMLKSFLDTIRRMIAEAAAANMLEMFFGSEEDEKRGGLAGAINKFLGVLVPPKKTKKAKDEIEQPSVAESRASMPAGVGVRPPVSGGEVQVSMERPPLTKEEAKVEADRVVTGFERNAEMGHAAAARTTEAVRASGEGVKAAIHDSIQNAANVARQQCECVCGCIRGLADVLQNIAPQTETTEAIRLPQGMWTQEERSRPKTWDGYPAAVTPQGEFQTRYTATVTEEPLNQGRPTNIPTVWEGKVLTELEAIKRAVEYSERTGKEWPSFDSIEEAEKAARTLSDQAGKPGGPAVIQGPMPPVNIPYPDLQIQIPTFKVEDGAVLVKDTGTDEGVGMTVESSGEGVESTLVDTAANTQEAIARSAKSIGKDVIAGANQVTNAIYLLKGQEQGQSWAGALVGFFATAAAASGGANGGTAADAVRAKGGPVAPGKTYLVGEEGPELFQPKVRGEIIPNAESMEALKEEEQGRRIKIDGARASGGPVVPGKTYLVGEAGRPELFSPGASGTNVPSGGGALTISPTYNIDARGATQDLAKQLPGILAAHSRQTVELARKALNDDVSRGAFGRV